MLLARVDFLRILRKSIVDVFTSSISENPLVMTGGSTRSDSSLFTVNDWWLLVREIGLALFGFLFAINLHLSLLILSLI